MRKKDGMSVHSVLPLDWANASEAFDQLKEKVGSIDLSNANEAQTRYIIIDALIREVFGWQPGQVKVEEYADGPKRGFVDYVLRVADSTLVIEAKRIEASFPTPTSKARLKLSGSVLGVGEIAEAIKQAEEYANSKDADVVCVTNGMCWCFFSTNGRDADAYATLLFPFTVPTHAEKLFDALSEPKARGGSLLTMSNRQPKPEDRLVSILRDADGRVDRNNIADHIVPALNEALYADALTSNPDSLEKCFVPTEARTRFDSLLGMYLADPKPDTIHPATRIRTSKEPGALEKLIDVQVSDHAPPVTLIIGPVGAGKSTYLKHFEIITGKNLLTRRSAHWVYIDFEKMGPAGKPRQFIYEQLKEYLISTKATKTTDYKSLVEPAYREEIAGLAKGPLALVFTDKAEFNRRTTDYIQAEFDAVEPYVDRLFRYLAGEKLCVIVLDNIDLYEDEKLETEVFAEGLALSKRLNSHVIVCLRAKTFVRHRNDAAFDAYELRKLWLDPPPFKSVLSRRLTYSRKILEGQPAKIAMANGMQLSVPDLGVFFEIVQRSVLRGAAGDYIESMSDLDIRRGLMLVNNFLTSGHIQADRALNTYIDGDVRYQFPFHEVFKGTALGQWRHYKESRADCINVFDARVGAKRTRLLRLGLLGHLANLAQHENTLEVPVNECIDLFATCGASQPTVIETLRFLQEHGLVRTASAEVVAPQERVVISRSGGYYLKKLCHTFVYAEECMYDTAIEDPTAWEVLSDLTQQIEAHLPIPEKMVLRRQRIGVFLEYLTSLEQLMLNDSINAKHLQLIESISNDVVKNADDAVRKAAYYYSNPD